MSCLFSQPGACCVAPGRPTDTVPVFPAGCALYRTWEAVVVGMIGGMLAVITMPLVDRLKIDDPVGAVSVHGVAGFWGVIAIGLFVDADSLEMITNGRAGLFKGQTAITNGARARMTYHKQA